MTIYTHDWEDLGDDRIHRWTNSLTATEQVKEQVDDPRRVLVRISTYIGTLALEAKHYTLTIEEQGNEWWSESKNDWIVISDDLDSSGLSARVACYTEEEAKQIGKYILSILFGKPQSKKRKLWRIVWED